MCQQEIQLEILRLQFVHHHKVYEQTNKSRNTYLTNFWRTLVMIFAEWAILLLGSLKVRALCAIYLASQINAERRLWITKAEQMKRNITHHFSLLCISWTRFKDKSGPKVEEKIGRNWPVESVNEPQSDGAQICGIGDHGAVAGILDQVHGTRERSCNLCGTNTERTSVRIRQMWANDNDDNMSVNMKERIRGWNQTNWKTKNIHLCIHTDSDELIDASDESFTLLIPTPLTPLAWQRLVHQLPHLLCGHRYTTSLCLRLWGCTTKTNPFNTPWHLLTKLCEIYSITKPQ